MVKGMEVKITDGMNHLDPLVPHNQHSNKGLGKQAPLHLFLLDSEYLWTTLGGFHKAAGQTAFNQES